MPALSIFASKVLVLLTDDLSLYLEVERLGGTAINFAHLREPLLA